jgi:hypothetical protein
VNQRSKKPPLKSPTRPGRPNSLTDRDKKILRFLWNWKIASSTSIHVATRELGSPYSTYKNLVRLEKSGLIESRHHLFEDFHVWTLSEIGFTAIRGSLGDLKEEGYLSENHPHDRLCLAFQLGEWAALRFPQVSHFTEQDLRRREVDDFPEWVPQSLSHRADGYTRIIGDANTVTFAYEIELSAKNVQKYESVVRFYQSESKVARVIWLVGSKEVLDAVLRAKERTREGSTNFHVFVHLADFQQNGWDASVFNERSVKVSTMREIYRRVCGDSLGGLLAVSRGPEGVADHLKSQKIIGRSKRSGNQF